jgi:hypothetical protein
MVDGGCSTVEVQEKGKVLTLCYHLSFISSVTICYRQVQKKKKKNLSTVVDHRNKVNRKLMQTIVCYSHPMQSLKSFE